MDIFKSEEIYRFWGYNVSHDHFLLRSGSDDGNIDILFLGVYYFDSVTMLRGICIKEAEINENPAIEKLKTHKNEKIFKIHSGDRINWIGALNFVVYKNAESCLDHNPLHGDDPGEMIVHS